MSPQHKDFGVECKNQKCRLGLILGEHASGPKTMDEANTFIRVQAGKLRCPTCGETHDYDQKDLRDFGLPGI